MQINDPQTLFSTQTIEPTVQNNPSKESQSWQPALSLLLITTLFCYGIFRYAVQLRVVLKNYWSIESTLDLIAAGNREYTSFLRYSKLLFVVLISTSLTTLICHQIKELKEYFFISTLAVISLSIVITLLQKILNRVSALFSQDPAVFHSVRSYSNLDVAIFAYILSPIAVITALTQWAKTWMIILLSLFYLFHILRSFIYLRKEKFYFSQWFLYLCGVEILPVMAVIAIIKSSQGFLTT